MPTVGETANGVTPLAGALAAGARSISYDERETFVLYKRFVLPLDGFVFWVRASALNSRRRSALVGAAGYNTSEPNATRGDPSSPPAQGGSGTTSAPNGSPMNTAQYNQPRSTPSPPPPVVVAGELVVCGSLHWTTVAQQQEDNSGAADTAIFTALEEVNDLDEVAPNEMYVATRGERRYAFSASSMRYEQAGLWHYRGQALNPQTSTQVVDDPAQLRPSQAVVSNSLPVWLAMAHGAGLPFFPSFAVPPNLAPPYVAVHIPPEETEALQPLPLIGPDGEHDQLCRDNVRLTLYGLRSDQALDLQDYVVAQMSDDGAALGMTDFPVVRDQKTRQVEMQVLAQHKTMTLGVSYYQSRARDAARGLILQAAMAITVAD